MRVSTSAYFAMNDLIAAHERFVRSQPDGRKLIAKYTDWSGLAFRGRCLDYSDLSGATLIDATFVASTFKFATLFGTNLSGADLRGANFFRADLRGVELRGANLYGACLDEADFSEAVIVRRMSGEVAAARGAAPAIRRVDFSNCTMRRARFRKAKLAGADFSGANLSGADLDGADLEGANLSGTILTGVNLKKVKIDKTTLAAAVVDPSLAAIGVAGAIRVAIESAETWAATSGRSGRLFEVAEADLRPLAQDFADRHLPMSKISNAIAIGCDFSRALLTGSIFENCDLREAIFSEADLRGVSFVNCRLNEADFRNAILGAVSFGDKGTRDTTFERCTLVNADFLPRVADKYQLLTRIVPVPPDAGQPPSELSA